jgi:hypothetical protein
MSIFTSWIITVGVFAGVFGVGKFLQYRERQQRLTRRMTAAIREDMARGAAAGAGIASPVSYWETSTFGTRYGEVTNYERQSRIRA